MTCSENGIHAGSNVTRLKGSCPQLRDQGWVKKSATGTVKLKPVMETINVGTSNVQTLWSTGKLELLRHEMNLITVIFWVWQRCVGQAQEKKTGPK